MNEDEGVAAPYTASEVEAMNRYTYNGVFVYNLFVLWLHGQLTGHRFYFDIETGHPYCAEIACNARRKP